MKLKNFLDNPFEIFWGGCKQFMIVLTIKWWAVPVMVVCGILWRIGGTEGGNKLARRIGVPLVLCGSTFCVFREWPIFLAVPFMIWACPWSYGADSWLFKKIKAFVIVQEKADSITRFILFVWYWGVFHTFLIAGVIFKTFFAHN